MQELHRRHTSLNFHLSEIYAGPISPQRKNRKKTFNSTELLANNRIIPHTFTYLHKIGRLRHIYGDISTG
jgi:Flp pilus assembly CpaF family ATPase